MMVTSFGVPCSILPGLMASVTRLGSCGAQDEFTLAVIAQNLRRLAKPVAPCWRAAALV